MERTIQLHEIDEHRWHPAYVEIVERHGWPVMMMVVEKSGKKRRRVFLAADPNNPEMSGILARHKILPVLFRGKDLINLRHILSDRSLRFFDNVEDVGFDCTTDVIKDEIRAGSVDKALTLLSTPPLVDWIILSYMHAFFVEVHASGLVSIYDKSSNVNSMPSESRFDDMVKEVLQNIARGAPRKRHRLRSHD